MATINLFFLRMKKYMKMAKENYIEYLPTKKENHATSF